MKKYFILINLILISSGCAPPSLATYEPVVDPYSTDMAAFQPDLVQCRGIASAAKAKYEKQASQQAATNLMVGAVSGALVGAAVGTGSANQGNLIATGAAAGAAGGATAGSEYATLVKYGPNRIVDRCLTNRGYKLLNDIGMGTN
ncbi:glycine zipper family protein [Pseudophaeobacter profundi]|uniref:glycine zipper family protein n=1 Tax=Pseudophaeobacter profundi TaxID=3034152 RepID=UPI002430E48D|nr:glycine zipper family protein [Pseudophaeobacter profundi]